MTDLTRRRDTERPLGPRETIFGSPRNHPETTRPAGWQIASRMGDTLMSEKVQELKMDELDKVSGGGIAGSIGTLSFDNGDVAQLMTVVMMSSSKTNADVLRGIMGDMPHPARQHSKVR